MINLLPATAVIGDALKAIRAVEHHLFNPDDVQAGKSARKKVLRAIPVVNLIPKTDYMINRDLGDISK